MLDEAKMAKLLGRSLTATETTNFGLYLNIALQRLEELLCFDLSISDEESEPEERTFDTRLDYRTVYVDPYTSINSVSIGGEETEDYTEKQNDKYNGDWYNIIEFDRKQTGEKIVVDAVWGFEALPDDLALLLAKLFAQGSVEQTSDNSVKSKKIEDFTVTFKDSATYNEFIAVNGAVIDKYSQCGTGLVRHGRIRAFRYY